MSNGKLSCCNSIDLDTKARLHRRAFLKAAGATGAVVGVGSFELTAALGEQRAWRPVDAKEARTRLFDGNRRFVHGKTRWTPMTPAQLIELEKGQHPFATIVGCSDSRVPVELIFDQGLGDLFVIRLAGHIVDPHVQGSLEYAFVHLDTKLIVVMGHEECGAVTAAMMAQDQKDEEPAGILHVLEPIEPIFENIDKSLSIADRVHLAVEANVRLSVKNILSYPGHLEAHKRGKFDVVGAVYDLHTGKVRFLDPS